MMKRGMVPIDSGWGGWLGRYDNRLAEASQELITNRIGCGTQICVSR